MNTKTAEPHEVDVDQLVPAPQNMLADTLRSQPVASDVKSIDTTSRELLNQPMTLVQRVLKRGMAKIQATHQRDLIRVQSESQIEDLRNLRKTATILLRDQLETLLTVAKTQLAAHRFKRFECEFTVLQRYMLDAQDVHFTWFERAFLDLPKFTVPKVKEERLRTLDREISSHQAVMEKALRMAGDCLENHLATSQQ
jgi:hypothetical protein